jgi:SAM-dependent methyltransferase
MIADHDISLKEIRRIERSLVLFSIKFLARGLFSKSLRSTKHYKEWYRLPLNYARIMELPLTLHLLGAAGKSRILDVSSPKLAALYLSSNDADITTSDLEEYFVDDFEKYKQCLSLRMESNVFDAAARIPYENDSFDKAFSISVLEHIPGCGDRKALLEMLRVVKPSGSVVITLPAFREYVEEWTSDDNYWKSVHDEKGKTFYQRRYDRGTLDKLIETDQAEIASILLIAEKPLREPELSPKGIMMHNSYLIDKVRLSRRIRKVSEKFPFLPLLPYLAERIASGKCHYLTTDWNDPNIRQVAVKMVKR